MDAVADWWHHDIIDGHRLALLIGFFAFVVTFVVTRGITRAIRAGRGPFRNISDGGVHLHHSTPGVLILVAGGFTSVAAAGRAPTAEIGACLVGVGASLVLDEFAMIFHLQDDYWSQEGQLSVNIATLAAACVALPLIGISPLGQTDLSSHAASIRGVVFAVLIAHLGFVVVTALKGKYGCATIGFFLSPVAWVASVRLARPTSPWARWRYTGTRMSKSRRRAAEFDRRWGPWRRRWDDFIGGSPSMAPRRADATCPPPAKPH